MATPESTLKQWLRKQFIKFAAERHLPVRCDQPQPGRFGTRGRPDMFIDIGPLHFRIEVKDQPNKDASGLQQVYLLDDVLHSRYRPLLVCGRPGAEQLMAALPLLMHEAAREQVRQLALLTVALNHEARGELPQQDEESYLEFRG